VFKAVVFAYSEVGFRCLKTLIEHGVDIPLVLTHEDAPTERQWFGSVAQLARAHRIEVACPANVNTEEWIGRVTRLEPHYVLAFYYRALLDERVLAAARWGALNMHGSLLPKYRGRAPVNWAILNGESETGATLHYMVRRPDAGAIVAQERVPIGIEDTALTVSLAVAAAAARLLERSLPLMASGPPPGRPMDLAQGSYFGGRSPADGRISWDWPAVRVHALIRAVAPPFPGAFAEVDSQRFEFAASHWTGEPAGHPASGPCLYAQGGRLLVDCRDGLRLAIPALSIDGEPCDATAFVSRYGPAPLDLDRTRLKGTPS
jgi:methionyl-tRNA formyltransferase